ncbi:MAG: GDP-mannose 4,6-dehydratase [Pirellulales bacterium]|nr:GDP-mannose 4,6-dehydratase [Pirellulales bacterium]
MARTALITGITGQDGSYLSEWLLEQGYEVHGLVRRSSTPRHERIAHLLDRVTLEPGDLLDLASLVSVIERVRPHEIYHLAAQSFVPVSWQQPLVTGEVTAMGTARLLEAVRLVEPAARFFLAGSSDMYGRVLGTPQRETTPLYPRSPDGAAKAYAHYLTINYRESFHLFACSGILFNHESPRRGHEFVTRKITQGVARIKHGLETELRLGNLEAQRDWGHAADYVRAMWLMLQHDVADEFVIGSGETHSVEEFVQIAFEAADLDWRNHVVVDPRFYRPAEVAVLRADPAKIRRELGWEPRISFRELVVEMVQADLARVAAGATGELLTVHS